MMKMMMMKKAQMTMKLVKNIPHLTNQKNARSAVWTVAKGMKDHRVII
ncbi:hypothetical protein GDO78_021783 [Eleutherodactylus coqui]|uniref:Uncharacterized protein n=1 Tax=Eleutherodactylus coqui TaxID=57060 RepID=A0A8J6BDI9_ELECQ|nr:hypothetical protein GDO78_021783 [Eleutherodactylus coqui]